MGGLDFSALDRLAYRGCETVEEQAQKDALIERGFTFVEEKDNPFLQASGTASKAASETAFTSSADISSTAPQTASESKVEASVSASGARDYRRLYRAAFEYHHRHTPPQVDLSYWSTHTAGADEPPELELRYWMEAAEDINQTAALYGNDSFLSGLLSAVYAELEREYNRLRKAAQERPQSAF